MLELIHKTIHRQRLEELLRESAPLLAGAVLDVGSKNRRYDAYLCHAKTITAIDIVPDEKHRVEAGDIEAGLNCPASSYNSILMLEVIEYLQDPAKAMREISRLLAPGGVAIITAPLMYREHGSRYHFTEAGFRSIVPAGMQIVRAAHIGNGCIVIADILGTKARNVTSRALRGLALLACLPLLAVASTKKNRSRDDAFYSGIFYVLKKI